MKYKFLKTIEKVNSIITWGKDIILYLHENEKFSCFFKQKLEVVWRYCGGYYGFLYKDKVFINVDINNTTNILSLNSGEVIESLTVGFYSRNCYILNNYSYGLQVIKRNEKTGLIKYNCLKFDIENRKVIKINESIYPFEILLTENEYLSMLDFDKIYKINYDTNEVMWEYKISELGPFLNDFDVLEPPRWEKRRLYNMYVVDNCLIVSVSKGIIALSLEQGELLWHKDLSFDPLYLSFLNGRIYCRDWESFASLDSHTGEIILQKKYTGFQINDEVIWSVQSYGMKIHDGKGYFMLDTSSTSYLLSMNLQTAEVSIETELPEVKSHVHTEDIHFEGNRLYIQDCASFLYVYEVID